MAEPDFEECWLDFLSRSDQNRIAAEFLKRNLDSLGLGGAERVLSIGPGNGEVDVDLMSVLPELKVYSAAEPDESLRGTLKLRVEDMGRNIQIDLKPDTIETYPGPSQPVDVILMVHVCYYFRDSFPVQIKRALQWLRPGGHLVLVHKEISPFRSEIENLMNRDHQSISISWSIAEKLTTINIPYKEEHTAITLDWTPPGLASIVRVFTNLYPNPKQLKQCEDIAKRHSKDGNTKVHESQLIQVIPQTALDHFN